MKNRVFFIILITFAILTSACNKKQLTPKPSRLIPFNQMVEIIKESYVIESMVYYLPPDSDKTTITRSLYNDLFVKHNITKEQYNSSIKYYLAEKTSADKLLNAVSDKIAQKRKQYVPDTDNNNDDETPNR